MSKNNKEKAWQRSNAYLWEAGTSKLILSENELGDEHYEEVITPPIVQALWSVKRWGYVKNGPPLSLHQTSE